jgi:DHA1 family multidrug/chloramphenicol efflux transport protein-like MFS transporter
MSEPLIHITRKQALLFALFLVLYEFLTYIANDTIMPGMIKVVESFHGSESDIADSLMMYLFGGASLQLFLGPLSDRFGRRPVMLFGAMLFFICTIAIGRSNSMEQFMAARFFQGMGLCFIGVIGYATLQEIFAEMDAIRLISVMASVALIAPLIGPLLGSICINYVSWRWIFVVIGGLALLAVWGLYQYMPETVGQIKRNGEVITPMKLSPSVIIHNYKSLLCNRLFMKGSFALGFQVLPCIVWIALAPIILVTEAKLSFIEYGLWQIPIFFACILGNIFLHRMTHKRTLQQLIRLGTAIITIGLIILCICPFVFGNHYIWLIPGMIVYFFGIGFAGSPLYRAVLYSTPMMKGMTAALMCMIGMCLQAVGLSIANFIYASHNNFQLAVYCIAAGAIYIALVLEVSTMEDADALKHG